MHVKMRLLILVFGFLIAGSVESIAAPPETISVGKFHLEWTGVIRDSNQGKSIPIQLQTSRGDIRADYYPATTNHAPTKMGVVWVEGAGNHGPDGSARHDLSAGVRAFTTKGNCRVASALSAARFHGALRFGYVVWSSVSAK